MSQKVRDWLRLPTTSGSNSAPTMLGKRPFRPGRAGRPLGYRDLGGRIGHPAVIRAPIKGGGSLHFTHSKYRRSV